MSGTVTFDRVPFGAPGSGLDYAGTVQAPVREVTVEAIANDGTNTVLDTVQTDTLGAYTLTVPVNTSVFVRVKAVMGSFRVCDNTAAGTCSNTAGGQLHFFDDAPFDSGGVATLARTPFNIPSGWGGTAYTSPREAAPFAILDAVYEGRQLVLSAEAGATFPPLNIYWSPENKLSAAFPPDISTGDIITTFFDPATSGRVTTTGVPSMYVLGDADGMGDVDGDGTIDDDTDEYDRHVILRTWAQYYLSAFSRLHHDFTLMGDTDDPVDSYDMRTAFAAGFSDAFAAMATGDSALRDSSGVGQSADDSADVEDNSIPLALDPGWYSEPSIAVIVYDMFDSANDDPVDGSFSLIHTAATGMRSMDALASIYPFVRRVSEAAPTQAGDILGLVTTQNIAVSADDFGTTETNDGGDPVTLPVYSFMTAPGTPATVYSTDFFGFLNALGNRAYVVLDVSTSVSSITATTNTTVCPSGAGVQPDPDIVLFRNGVEIARAEDPVVDTETLDSNDVDPAGNPFPLGPGRYIIEVSDGDNAYGPLFGIPQTGETCFDVTVSP